MLLISFLGVAIATDCPRVARQCIEFMSCNLLCIETDRVYGRILKDNDILVSVTFVDHVFEV
jgi:hypothetical protein